MKRTFLLLLALLLCACSDVSDKPSLHRNSPIPLSFDTTIKPVKDKDTTANEDKYEPINFQKVKAIWISYIELSPILSLGEDHFREQFEIICDNCKGLGINTLYVHVRAFADAFYPSRYYPYSKAFGGITFDALSVMLDAAHERGLSFHAWINPLRCEAPEAMKQLSHSIVNDWIDDPDKYPQYVVYVESTGHYWLDPAAEEVRTLIADGARELAANYEIDGIHIDDYFYPTTDESFDDKFYEKYGGGASLSDWRLENCSKMVSRIYSAIKEENPAVEFGISPQGNIGNNYSFMFADVKRWCSEEGFADYITPQLYFGYENPVLPYAKAFEEWVGICRDSKIKLIIGIGAYKINSEEEFINDTGIIARQAEMAANMTDGAAIYSYNSLFGSDRGSEERQILAELFKFCSAEG